MEYIEFIHQIKEISDEEYLIWYMKTIKNSKTLNLEKENGLKEEFKKLKGKIRMLGMLMLS